MKNPKVFMPLALVSLFGPASAAGPFDARWNEGAERCPTFAAGMTESRAYDETTIVLRQNPCVNFEAPFVYLLIGGARALLVDSGASDAPEASNDLYEAVERHLRRPDGTTLPLTVVHTHGHLDHRAGDAMFGRKPFVTVVPSAGEPMRRGLGIDAWPDGKGAIDLGDRTIDVIPAPGHHEDHVVFYDRRTRLLLTGDFLLPGRLLVDDIDAYEASARRVADFVGSHPVSEVFGAHIELDATGDLYTFGATVHPNERALALTVQDVQGLPAALAAFNGFYSPHPNYVVVNPIRNLIALACGVIAALVLLVWIARRLWKRRRARRLANSS
jgi:hydroxyacylglutathione hydrolase